MAQCVGTLLTHNTQPGRPSPSFTGNKATEPTAASNLPVNTLLHYTRRCVQHPGRSSQHITKISLSKRLQSTALLQEQSGSQILQSSRILGQFVRRVGPPALPSDAESGAWPGTQGSACFYPQVILMQVGPERNVRMESQRFGVRGTTEVITPQSRKPGGEKGGNMFKATPLTNDGTQPKPCCPTTSSALHQ